MSTTETTRTYDVHYGASCERMGFLVKTLAERPSRALTLAADQGGEQAVQLKVAEQAVHAYAQLAQKNNTMIVPGNMSEVSALIGSAMTLVKGARPV